MKRRQVLLGAALAAGASFHFPAPAVARGLRELTMVTDWPEGPGLFASARRLAQSIGMATGGRLRIEVLPSGALVRPFETFDAVEAGIADMFHSHTSYFEEKSSAFHFYSALPFGFTANEMLAWVRFGGGQELWDRLSANFHIKPFLCCNTGTQMGGWFVNEIKFVEDFSGLRYRMAGLGAEVFRRLGAIVILLPAADIVQSLQSGAIEACEWGGPWIDTVMGLHTAARYYYYPGWHEPGAAVALGINKSVWESLAPEDQQVIEITATNEYAISLAEFNTNNARALQQLRAEGVIHIQGFNEEILRSLARISSDVVTEAASGDKLSREIHESYLTFRDQIVDWSNISESTYIGIRMLR
ncbi:TRAP transporter substrate-binding protein [Fodinicurvata halophila]|uniref:TRAP transporter substrate-binding protein n=1 Tax=Fodinicurvata halophila TaxID=1419723 RepID=A0ABV8UN88_9PROT